MASEGYVLRLFLAGQTGRSRAAVENLHRICEQELAGRYRLELIDVLEQPDVAEEYNIVATPTLIKTLPPPLRRIIGDLSDSERVLLGLDLHPRPAGLQ
ncbi:MAG: circadian clock KaiB family protein [Guyparkeria sp.]|uniref:circadian clock KaiB family protein n=1 Tax=Guyparkeria sp. TaxID=2035736 RepID=UPI00397C6358